MYADYRRSRREVCQPPAPRRCLAAPSRWLGSSYADAQRAGFVSRQGLAEEQVHATVEENRAGRNGPAVSAFPRKLGESLASIRARREDRTGDHAVARSAQGLQPRAPHRRTTGDFDSVPFFAARSISILSLRCLLRASARLFKPWTLDESRKMTARAYELRGKSAKWSGITLDARYYTTAQPECTEALDTYKVWLATYPNDYTALTNSALLHKQHGDLPEAIRKLELCHAVCSDQPARMDQPRSVLFRCREVCGCSPVIETAIQTAGFNRGALRLVSGCRE